MAVETSSSKSVSNGEESGNDSSKVANILLGVGIALILIVILAPVFFYLYRRTRKLSTKKRKRRENLPKADLKNPAKEKEREALHKELLRDEKLAHGGKALQKTIKHEETITPTALTSQMQMRSAMLDFAPIAVRYYVPLEDFCRQVDEETTEKIDKASASSSGSGTSESDLDYD